MVGSPGRLDCPVTRMVDASTATGVPDRTTWTWPPATRITQGLLARSTVAETAFDVGSMRSRLGVVPLPPWPTTVALVLVAQTQPSPTAMGPTLAPTLNDAA